MTLGPLHRAGVLALACVAGTGVARGDAPPRARLDYTLGPGAEQCPDRARLAILVATHLGYDPFDAQASQRLVVEIVGEQGALTASLHLFGPEGRLMGSQRLSSPDPQCRDLAASLALALSLAIDPLGSTRPKPPPPPAAPPAVEVHPAPPPQPAAPPVVFALAVGADGVWGALPAAAAAVTLGGEARWRRASLGLSVGLDMPAGQSAGAASFQAWLLSATLSPCLRLWLFGACALLSAGVVSASGAHFTDPQSPSTPYLAGGAQLFADIPLAPWFALRPRVELDVPILRTALVVGQTTLWTMSPVVASLGAGAVVLFK
ncbi:MAG: hypothetical protein ACYDCL_23295 [Myxococcales bacterium]